MAENPEEVEIERLLRDEDGLGIVDERCDDECIGRLKGYSING